jgi:hypothetical protein
MKKSEIVRKALINLGYHCIRKNISERRKHLLPPTKMILKFTEKPNVRDMDN